MNPTVITIAGILLAGGIAGHFNRYPGDFMILVRAIRGGLSTIKQCLLSWPIQESIIALVLTVLGTTWVIEVLL